jgi:hypothetical protein
MPLELLEPIREDSTKNKLAEATGYATLRTQK